MLNYRSSQLRKIELKITKSCLNAIWEAARLLRPFAQKCLDQKVRILPHRVPWFPYHVLVSHPWQNSAVRRESAWTLDIRRALKAVGLVQRLQSNGFAQMFKPGVVVENEELPSSSRVNAYSRSGICPPGCTWTEFFLSRCLGGV